MSPLYSFVFLCYLTLFIMSGHTERHIHVSAADEIDEEDMDITLCLDAKRNDGGHPLGKLVWGGGEDTCWDGYVACHLESS